MITLHIIDSTRYRKLRPFRYAIYIICFVAIYSTIRPFGRLSITDYLSIKNIVVYVLVFILIIIGIWLYYYSKNYKELGSMVLGPEFVSIDLGNGAPVVYPISELADFKISRGSTVHHIDDDRYPPETNDNWISFSFNRVEFKYEFSITDIIENDQFEAIINDLRKRYDTFYYESI